MRLKCLQCNYEFDGCIEYDELGWHSSCPCCNGSFDVDIKKSIDFMHDDCVVHINFTKADKYGTDRWHIIICCSMCKPLKVQCFKNTIEEAIEMAKEYCKFVRPLCG